MLDARTTNPVCVYPDSAAHLTRSERSSPATETPATCSVGGLTEAGGGSGSDGGCSTAGSSSSPSSSVLCAAAGPDDPARGVPEDHPLATTLPTPLNASTATAYEMPFTRLPIVADVSEAPTVALPRCERLTARTRMLAWSAETSVHSTPRASSCELTEIPAIPAESPVSNAATSRPTYTGSPTCAEDATGAAAAAEPPLATIGVISAGRLEPEGDGAPGEIDSGSSPPHAIVRRKTERRNEFVDFVMPEAYHRFRDVANQDLPVLLGPTNTVNGRNSTRARAIGPQSVTSSVRGESGGIGKRVAAATDSRPGSEAAASSERAPFFSRRPVRRKRSLRRWSASGTSAGAAGAPRPAEAIHPGTPRAEERARRWRKRGAGRPRRGAPVHRRSYRFTYLCSSGRTVSATQTSPLGVIVM